jgi:membrane-bound inhibitor of C-type lysozyme
MIKRLLMVLSFIAGMCSPVLANSSILDLRVSPAQIFDVQWSISGDTFTARNFTRPFYSVNPNGTSCSWCQMTTAQVQSVFDNNQYFGFFASTTNPGTYGLAIFNSDGTRAWTLHNTGSFRALSADVVFYNGNNFWGTVISVTEGFNYGDSNVWTGITNNPTQQQLQEYEPGATEPLAAGETASSPPPPPPEPVFSSSVTVQQAARRDTAFANTTGNQADVFIQGHNNSVSVEQIGPGHYSGIDILGNTNTVSVDQHSNSGRHYSEATVIGSGNSVEITQEDADKSSFVEIVGNNNTAVIEQKGSGAHYANVSIQDNEHSALVSQSGSGDHSATVVLSGTQPWDFRLYQDGSTGKTYSLPHDMTDGSSVSGHCATVGGCSLVVTQN